MSLTVTTSYGLGYGKVIVNQEGNKSADDHRALRRIGAFALTYKHRTWKNPARPWVREEPDTTPTTGDWSLTTLPGEQQNIAAIVSDLIAGREEALTRWNQQ